MILNMMVEGNSMRSMVCVVGVSINTVTILLIEAGGGCAKYHNSTVLSVKTTRVECDEIWSFIYDKNKNVKTVTTAARDVWTWTAIEADSKMILSY